jgi:hypothetical protein
VAVGEAVGLGVLVERVAVGVGIALGLTVVVLDVAVGLVVGGRLVLGVAGAVGWTDGEYVGRGHGLCRGCGTLCPGRGQYV